MRGYTEAGTAQNVLLVKPRVFTGTSFFCNIFRCKPTQRFLGDER